MKDTKNKKKDGESKYSEFLEKIESKTKKYQQNIVDYKTKENEVMNKLDELKSKNDAEEEGEKEEK